MNVEGGARSLSDEESWLHDDAPGSHERQPHGQLSESVSPGVAMSPGVETSFDFLAALDRGATQRKKAPQSPAEKHTRMRKAAASGGKKASVAANNRKVPAGVRSDVAATLTPRVTSGDSMRVVVVCVACWRFSVAHSLRLGGA